MFFNYYWWDIVAQKANILKGYIGKNLESRLREGITVDPWTMRIWTVQVHLYADFSRGPMQFKPMWFKGQLTVGNPHTQRSHLSCSRFLTAQAGSPSPSRSRVNVSNFAACTTSGMDFKRKWTVSPRVKWPRWSGASGDWKEKAKNDHWPHAKEK